MFERLQGDFYSEDGIRYTVTILVNDLPGLALDFKLSKLAINYNGDDNNLHAPILSSTCELAVEVTTSSVNSVFSRLNVAAEEDYMIKIEKEGVLHWCGIIITDNVSEQDRNIPYTLNLSAVDGFGRLKDKDYTGTGTDWEGETTIIQHLYNIFSFVPTSDFWGENDVYFASHIQMFSINQLQTVATSPLIYTRIHHRVFRSVDTKGVISYSSVYDVLAEIAKAFASRFFLAEGRYNLEQVNRYASDDTDTTIKTWSKTAGELTDEVYNNWGGRVLVVDRSEERLAGNADLTKRSGGLITYHSPLNHVKVTYNHFSTRYTALTLNEWTHDGNEIAQILDYDSSDGDYKLQLNIYLQLFLNYTVGEYITARAKIRATITVDDGTDVYYLHRPASYNFGVSNELDAFWSTDVGYHDLYTSNIVALIPSNPTSTTLSNIIDVVTPPLPVSGDISISFEFLELQALASVVNAANYTYSYLIQAQSVSILPSGVVDSRSVGLEYRVNNTETTNTDKIEVELILGDGPTPNSFGRFTVWNGSAWNGSGSWHDLGSNDIYAHGEYIAQQILIPRLEPNERLEGGIIGTPSPFQIIERSGNRYILLRAKINLGSGTSDGVWSYITDLDTKASPPNIPAPLGFKFDKNNPFSDIELVQNEASIRPVLDRITLDTGVVFYTNSVIQFGALVSSLSLSERAHVHGFFAGDILNIVHPNNGYSQQLIVDATSATDKVIPVTNFRPEVDYPVNSFITLGDGMLTRLADKSRRKLLTFQLVPYHLDIPSDSSFTPVQFDQFFRVPASWDNYRLTAVSISVHSPGVGSTAFSVRVTKTGGFIEDTTQSFTGTQTRSNLSTYWELSTDDLIEFYLQSTNATTETRPKGLIITLEIIATLL